MASTLNYQVLLNAVYAATGARGSVYPNDYNYIALPMNTVQNEVNSFITGGWRSEEHDCDDIARELWFQFKYKYPQCACGMVRLSSPVAHDIVGIVTEEDLMQVGSQVYEVEYDRGYDYEPSYDSCIGDRPCCTPSTVDILRDDLLGDEIPEYQESFDRGIPGLTDRAERPRRERPTRDRPTRRTREGGGSSGGSGGGGIEMTLIEPSKKQIFKRSRGGTFGYGWPVSSIRAFAVWF